MIQYFKSCAIGKYAPNPGPFGHHDPVSGPGQLVAATPVSAGAAVVLVPSGLPQHVPGPQQVRVSVASPHFIGDKQIYDIYSTPRQTVPG